jgi:hypothetical protein
MYIHILETRAKDLNYERSLERYCKNPSKADLKKESESELAEPAAEGRNIKSAECWTNLAFKVSLKYFPVDHYKRGPIVQW